MRGRATAVVGGGILGLAVAREVLRREPGSTVTVLEAADHLGAGQSGHNSGVVHAGLYYEPGSLKATLCRRGMGLLRDYCAEHGVAYRELGKVVVAATPDEVAGLDRIEERSRRNGVPGLARLDRRGLTEVEPSVAGVAALHSPRTAVVDYVAVCRALADDVRAAGGEVRLGAPVTAVRPTGDRVHVVTGGPRGAPLVVDRLVACAGVRSDQVAALVGVLRDVRADVRIVPFRGEYHRLGPDARDRVRGLVYPVPDPRYPFLGIHLTRTVDDEVLVGPNAVLALARDGYRWRDVDLRDLREVLSWPGTRRLAARHWRTGARELAGSLSRRRFAAAAARYLPGLTAHDLVPARSGVRAQAVARDGALVDDFVVQRVGPVALLRNAPSPGATSSMAIAEHVLDLLADPAA
ncbi:MAG TPA: L-2-hydroxyglutarate oxidase [Actinomycetes bacterium]|nr:L-2-hydroxyglutarate oxidase [Actinomycetes bacterium]